MRERVVLVTALVAAWVAGMGDVAHAALAPPIAFGAAAWAGIAAGWLLDRLPW